MGKVGGKGQAEILSNQQIQDILKYCREPYRYAVAIAAYTGCRMGEAIKLQVENLNLPQASMTLTHTKTGKPREIPMHPDLVEILKAAELPSSGYLFPSSRSAGYISRQVVDKELREVCEALGIQGVGTHSFRRSLATKLHGKGVPLKAIAGITGHESLDSLARYIEVTPEQKRAAVMHW